MKHKKFKIIICLNTSWNLVNFRSGLITALAETGQEIIAVAPFDNYSYKLAALNCKFTPLHMDNGGTNPFKDLILLSKFLWLFLRERPDIFLGYTIKPNIYGSIAAHIQGIPVINNISGLGASFMKDGFFMEFVCYLYKISLKKSSKVFFQNQEDLNFFINNGLILKNICDVIPGSGINLDLFKPISKPMAKNGVFRFLLVARLLQDKGVNEYVQAARLLKSRWPHADFCLLGFLDVQNPSSISQEQVNTWVTEGVVNYLGVSDDVRNEISTADCVVLPSYREGTPRSLLEAAAMAIPVITTDAAGCRDVVNDGENGFLCKVRDAVDLAEKMERMMSLSIEQRQEMGRKGRAKMEAEYDEQIVISKYLSAIDSIRIQQSTVDQT